MRRFAQFALLASSIIAVPVVAAPAFETFGALPQATFGGTGIPNDAVAIATGSGATIGLTAHERFCNPEVTNDGAGTFFAMPGANAGGCPGQVGPARALWNFAFFFDLADGSGQRVLLDYDNDTSAAVSGGTIDITGFYGDPGQDSYNATFGFLGAFDPNANGIYTYGLRLLSGIGGTQLEAVAIDVVVGDVQVPEPALAGLLGLGALGLMAARRRKA